MQPFRVLKHLVLPCVLLLAAHSPAAERDPIAAAQSYRKDGRPVTAQPDGTLICEAEEFQARGQDGWQTKPWGTNYYVATFANSFMSRKAYLGAPETGPRTEASLAVQVPKAGKYLALVRYEAAYRFETQFRLRIEQAGKVKLDRLYGARNNLKVWAFRQKLKTEIAWDWGAGENFVWEGHDAVVDLDAGPARLTLIADPQKGDAARRNVDVLVLTPDLPGVANRIDKENYLPLDGLLTQSGDLYLRVHNHKDGAALKLTLPPGTEHSPYWVHLRTWKPIAVSATVGQTTDWVEVGSLLDTLNDGQWQIGARGSGPLKFDLEFGVRGATGKIESIRRLDGLTGDVALAYDADTRYTRRIRLQEDVLRDLVDYLRKQSVRGTPPRRTLVYGYTFDPKPGHPRWNALREEFIKLSGATALVRDLNEDTEAPGGLVRGYIDVRGVPTAKLEEYCKKLAAEGRAKNIAVVSLGDEIGLAAPPATDHKGFRDWLKSQKWSPKDIDPAAGNDWEKVTYSPNPETATSRPGLYYYSRIYAYRYGIRQLKDRTDILRRHLPNAGIGANFSPHHKHLYLGDTHHWISVFREDGMTMPWGEDYIWQVPVGTQQINFLMLDMFRAGIRNKPGAKIHYYVMPHTPGNTTASWRRQLYGDLAHGAKILNLFEYRPVQAAYTENHCSDPAMYQGVRQCLHELGRFEDVVQDGHVRPGVAGLWFSEAADVWDDNAAPFDVAKRTLYIAIRQRQLPLDAVVEGDDLSAYKVLYLTDRHVSRKASAAIAKWVESGGRLLATAGAGMFDEMNRPNTVLRQLLGVEPRATITAKEPLRREKEDLPFAQPLDRVTLTTDAAKVQLPVLGVKAPFAVKAADAAILGTFANGSPAWVMRSYGKGKAWYCGFLPGLSYFQPALPRRPVDRGATDDTLSHFIPTAFDPASIAVVATPAADVERPVVCSEPLVETTVLDARSGVVIPLINWSGKPVKGLTVTLTGRVPAGRAELAGGGAVKVTREGGKVTFTLDLDVADALVLR